MDRPTCGIRRGVVAARWSDPSEASARKAEAKRLAVELKSARAELKRHHSAAKSVAARIANLERKLSELNVPQAG